MRLILLLTGVSARSSRRSCRPSTPRAPIEPVADRIRALYNGQDKVGAFLRSTLGPTLDYASGSQAISPTARKTSTRRCGGVSAGSSGRWKRFALSMRNHQPPTPNNSQRATPKPNSAAAGSSLRVVRKNAGASLIDLGDGVLAVEFHSKMNAIGGDTIQMLHAGVKEASRNFAALVVGNDGPNFSAGANLMLLLLEAQEGNWDDVDLMVRGFQGATMALQARRRAGRRRAGRPDARRRLRGRAARRPRAGRGGDLHRPRRSRRRPDSRAAAAPRRCWRGRWSRCRRAPMRCRRFSASSRRSASRRSSTSGPDAQRIGYLRDGGRRSR